MPEEPLLEALGIDGGIVCAVGAGGKKSTLYRIAEQWRTRLALTASVFSAPPARRVYDERITASGDGLLDAVRASTARRIAYAEPSDKPGRVAGVAPELICQLHDAGRFDLTLVKADGARMRGIKAPRADEPVLPADTGVVLHLTSAAVLGATLSEAIAHRLPELTAVTGAQPGEVFTPQHLANLITAPTGARAHVNGARLVPVINQVDDQARCELARQAARQALNALPGLKRIVLTAMRAEQPVVAIVE